jgi:hypothetical protein
MNDAYAKQIAEQLEQINHNVKQMAEALADLLVVMRKK